MKNGSAAEEIKAYLYNADGSDEELSFDEAVSRRLGAKQLLWINILERKQELVEKVVKALDFEDVPVRNVLNKKERPKLDKFENFYRFFIFSVERDADGRINHIPIDFLCAKNVVVTIHDGDVNYFREFRKLEKGETYLGELDTESFIATLLDFHIITYFRMLEQIEDIVDELDQQVLKTEMDERKFLKETLRLKGEVAKLRRWLMPHRDLFYALARPDFRQVSESDSSEHFRLIIDHFEVAIESLDVARETVYSLFAVQATRADQKMNQFIQRLTFITLTVGILAVISGTFGMNFEVGFFKSAERGFWLTIAAMAGISIGLGIFAKLKKWI